ncbi:MAG: 4Fe-4S binding protein, partial [Bacillota bacterium]|nr:4Fe-4S binding protein [Bacillota bacterium]
QVGTSVMIEGRDIVKNIVSELEEWIDNHNVKDISQLRGIALSNLRSYDEMKFEPSISTASGVPCDENCNACIKACMYNAITRESKSISVDRGKCTGCGLCISICPKSKLQLSL